MYWLFITGHWKQSENGLLPTSVGLMITEKSSKRKDWNNCFYWKVRHTCGFFLMSLFSSVIVSEAYSLYHVQ